MSYDCVAKALYDYAAQDEETELSFEEGAVLYIIDKEDDQWWKAKLKPAEGQEGEDKIGLVPCNYVEEIPPIGTSTSLYPYTPTSPDELPLTEDAPLLVFELGEEWNLVRLASGGKIGFVPANYTEATDDGAGAFGGAVGGGEVQEIRGGANAPGEASGLGGGGYVDPAERVRSAQGGRKEKDEIVTWSVSILDKKGKKKKGTLGVGNGAIFFASESDKTPVQQYPITSLSHTSQPSSKTLLLICSSEEMTFHCGDKTTGDLITAKLEDSKRIASGGAEVVVAERQNSLPMPRDLSDEEEEEPAAKAVRWAPSPTASNQSALLPPPSRTGASVPAGKPAGKKAVALYDFDAAGEDELSVKEGEDLEVVDDGNEDWWTVRNGSGGEGVVPAQYVELGGGSGAVTPVSPTSFIPPPAPIPVPQPMSALQPPPQRTRSSSNVTPSVSRTPASDDNDREDEEAARQAAKKDARRKEKARAAEEEREREEQEERERDRRERKERRRAMEERERREEESARRREATRQAQPEPPKLKQRPSTNDVAAARNLPNPKGRGLPDRPEGGKNRPNPSRTRVWHDKSGQFRVEAELLGVGGGKIRLHKLNGVVIEVPAEKMSPEDIAFIKRHQRNKNREAEDDAPLSNMASASRHSESSARSSPAPSSRPAPPAAAPPKPKRNNFDWFEFFLNAGCDMDDCTRYARNFEKDKIDDQLLPDLELSTLRNLGLREGDVIRVKKHINAMNPKHTAEQASQIKKDEELARQLQEAENSGRGASPAPNLFTNTEGKLANNTRRGRPEKKASTSAVDSTGIAAASEHLTRQPSPPLLPPSPPPAPLQAPVAPKPAPLISGFDDEWVPKPVTPKPASPNPTGSSANPGIDPGIANQLAQLKLNQPQAQQASNSFDFLTQINQNRTGASTMSSGSGYAGTPPPSFHAGLGMGSSTAPMGQLLHAQQTGAFNQPQQQQQDQTRGPLAPVPANQALLSPLIPAPTGYGSAFVPTRPSPQPQMMQGQPTGYGMMPQQTGFAYGQSPYGAQQPQPQQQQYMQPNMTGFIPQPSPMFNAFASVPQQGPPPQQEGNKFTPANIFANMKQGATGAQSPGPTPQPADKYDALRPQPTGMLAPLTTGYNGAMMPQPTGYMNGQQMYMQPTGYMNGQQQQQGYRY